MEVKPLTKPMSGIDFEFLGYVCNINVAKTLVWARDIQEGDEYTRTLMYIAKEKSIKPEIGVIWSYIFGPFKLLIAKAL